PGRDRAGDAGQTALVVRLGPVAGPAVDDDRRGGHVARWTRMTSITPSSATTSAAAILTAHRLSGDGRTFGTRAEAPWRAASTRRRVASGGTTARARPGGSAGAGAPLGAAGGA